MTRRYARFLQSLALSVALVASLAGCPDDPYDPQTWIDKLDDRAEVKNAITQLQRLKTEKGISKAIVPLSDVWEKQNRPKKVLSVIIEIASGEPLCDPDNKEKKCNPDGPHWEEAVPVLQKAVEEFDVGDQNSIDNAIVAADALGRAGIKDAVPTLIRAVNKSMPQLSPGQRVRLSAIAALGKFGNDSRAVEALVKVMSADPKNQPVPLFAATALALADARSADAVEPLIVGLFKIAPIFAQCRRALINIGPPARDRLITIFKGKDEVLNQLAKDNKFNINCSKRIGPETDCAAPSNLQYKSALLLGDFYSSEAVKPLLAGLDDAPLPSFFEQGIPGPSQHTAILDALKKIGDFSAADRVWKYSQDSGTDDGVRPLAIDTYSYLTMDTDKLGDLAKLIKDDEADEQVRMASGIAYGRLARSEDQYDPLKYMIDRYKKEADKKDKDVKKAQDAYDKAKKKHDELNKEFLANKEDKKLEAKVSSAREAMDTKRQELSMAEGRVAAYRGFQRSFEQNLARAHVAVMCKKDAECYMGILSKSEAEIGAALGKHIQDFDKWSEQEKKDLKVAAVERALIEIRKLGEGARSVEDKLLEQVASKDRITRQGTLMALVKVAALPCDKCVKRMEEVLEDQREETTLQALAVETEAVRGYFLWAGK